MSDNNEQQKEEITPVEEPRVLRDVNHITLTDIHGNEHSFRVVDIDEKGILIRFPSPADASDDAFVANYLIPDDLILQVLRRNHVIE